MGYYTNYSLETDSQENKNIIEEFREIDGNAKYAIDANGDCQEWTKWYDHEEDLKNFSKNYPDVIFILSGEGEESGDIWKKYFKNGKMQVAQAKISFEEFNENKLKQL